MKSNLDLDTFEGMTIPKKIAVCPYCDASLWLSTIEGMVCQDDGNWIVDEIELVCSAIDQCEDDDEQNEFINWHSRNPYVNWMPLEQKIISWLNKNYIFVESKTEQRKLRSWVEKSKEWGK